MKCRLCESPYVVLAGLCDTHARTVVANLYDEKNDTLTVRTLREKIELEAQLQRETGVRVILEPEPEGERDA